MEKHTKSSEASAKAQALEESSSIALLVARRQLVARDINFSFEARQNDRASHTVDT